MPPMIELGNGTDAVTLNRRAALQSMTEAWKSLTKAGDRVASDKIEETGKAIFGQHTWDEALKGAISYDSVPFTA
ncbi:hypothetical protein LTR37_009163 [Vermiconidia calcicola]|uniref:Uncharacterized protein n=1 Tax=Vermiconidia calcicola TaxID=1690605 RepID=A0ACC3N954_9PEZI|nr:hypothetical protein LTR37_009163 [Vermiconidia calcicola]